MRVASSRVQEKKIAVGNEGSGVFKTYFGQDDSSGLKVSPVTVLVGSLFFILIVVLLHFYGRFFR